MRWLTDEGEELPFWYGLTYRDPSFHGWKCHPIPLNFIVRWSRNLWFFFAQEQKADFIDVAFEAGREAGRKTEARMFEIRFDSDIKELNRWRSWALGVRETAESGDKIAGIMAEMPLIANAQTPIPWP